jgi:hypothetical protein
VFSLFWAPKRECWDTVWSQPPFEEGTRPRSTSSTSILFSEEATPKRECWDIVWSQHPLRKERVHKARYPLLFSSSSTLLLFSTHSSRLRPHLSASPFLGFKAHPSACYIPTAGLLEIISSKHHGIHHCYPLVPPHGLHCPCSDGSHEPRLHFKEIGHHSHSTRVEARPFSSRTRGCHTPERQTSRCVDEIVPRSSCTHRTNSIGSIRTRPL